MMPEPSALIAGDGPTELNLALALGRRNEPHRIISEVKGPGEQSRAMVVQARTLEFYGQYGFAEEAIRQGVIIETVHAQKPSRHEAASVGFEDLGDGISPNPFALAWAQDDHERFLVHQLESLGTRIEWGVKLTGFEETSSGVHATVKQNGRAAIIKAAWILLSLPRENVLFVPDRNVRLTRVRLGGPRTRKPPDDTTRPGPFGGPQKGAEEADPPTAGGHGVGDFGAAGAADAVEILRAGDAP